MDELGEEQGIVVIVKKYCVLDQCSTEIAENVIHKHNPFVHGPVMYLAVAECQIRKQYL